jgi:hypothetical protein
LVRHVKTIGDPFEYLQSLDPGDSPHDPADLRLGHAAGDRQARLARTCILPDQTEHAPNVASAQRLGHLGALPERTRDLG